MLLVYGGSSHFSGDQNQLVITMNSPPLSETDIYAGLVFSSVGIVDLFVGRERC